VRLVKGFALGAGQFLGFGHAAVALDAGDDELAFEALAGFLVRVDGHVHERPVLILLDLLLPLLVPCHDGILLLRTQIVPPSGDFALGEKERRWALREVSEAWCGWSSCGSFLAGLVLEACFPLLLPQIILHEGVSNVVSVLFLPERNVPLRTSGEACRR